jgi:hypothetical protein
VTLGLRDLEVVCGESKDGGATWSSFTPLPPVFTPEGPPGHPVRDFIGDYVWWDGTFIAFGALKPPTDDYPRPRPYIEVHPYAGPGCAVVAPVDSAPGEWWIAAMPVLLGLMRRRGARAVALAALLVAAPALAYPENGCIGDCDQNGRVTINELIGDVDVALNGGPECAAFECNILQGVHINCMIVAVKNALAGCFTAAPTPTPVP